MKIDSRMRTIALIAGIISLPVIVFFVFSLSGNVRRQHVNEEEIVHQRAQYAAQGVSSQLAQYVSMLDMLGAAFGELPQDAGMRNNFITHILASRGDIVDFAIVDGRGKEIVHAPPNHAGKNALADRSQNVEFLSLKEKNFYIGPVFLSQNNPVFLIGRPLFSSDGTTIRGGIFALLKADNIMALLARTGTDSASAFMVNEKGVLVAHASTAALATAQDTSLNPAAASILKNDPALTHLYKNRLTETVVGSAVPLHLVADNGRELNTNWFLIFEMPAAIAYASASSGRNVAWELLVLVLLGITGVSVFIGRKLDMSFDKVARILQEWNAGHFDSALEKYKNAKLQSAATSLNSLAHNLEHLTRRVDEGEQAIRHERSKFNLACSEVSDAVLVCDAKHHIIFANKPAEYLTGYSSEMMNGRHIDEIVRLREGEKTIALSACDRGAIWGRGLVAVDVMEDLYLITGVAEKRPVIARIGSYIQQDIGHGGFVVTLRDMSRQQFLDTASSNFVASAVYKLRAPLTEVKWALSFLLGKESGELSSQQKKNMKRMSESNEYAIRLADDIVKTAVLKTGEMPIQRSRVDMKQIISDLLDSKIAAAKKQSITLTYKKPRGKLYVSADGQAIKIALQNMLNNTFYYTPKGGEIAVSLEKMDQDIRIDVADTGIGIAKEDQKFIFDPFFRGSNARTAVPHGTGLGLSIAQKIIRGHGGHIDVESELNRGARFTITIPIETSHYENALPPLSPPL